MSSPSQAHSSPMSQADPSRHVSDFPHGSRSKVPTESSSPLIQELKIADAGATPSRGLRGGVAVEDADCMKKDPEINVGSPEMGGSREAEELTHLLRAANAEAFVDTPSQSGHCATSRVSPISPMLRPPAVLTSQSPRIQTRRLALLQIHRMPRQDIRACAPISCATLWHFGS